jgi:hypothetical protein
MDGESAGKKKERAGRLQIGDILPSFLADLKIGFHSSSSATKYRAILGALGRQGDGEGVE